MWIQYRWLPSVSPRAKLKARNHNHVHLCVGRIAIVFTFLQRSICFIYSTWRICFHVLILLPNNWKSARYILRKMMFFYMFSRFKNLCSWSGSTSVLEYLHGKGQTNGQHRNLRILNLIYLSRFFFWLTRLARCPNILNNCPPLKKQQFFK